MGEPPARHYIELDICPLSALLSPFSPSEYRQAIGVMLEYIRSAKGSSASFNVELSLVTDAQIAELNESYLGCVGPTNVLSFPVEQSTSAGSGLFARLAETASATASPYDLHEEMPDSSSGSSPNLSPDESPRESSDNLFGGQFFAGTEQAKAHLAEANLLNFSWANSHLPDAPASATLALSPFNHHTQAAYPAGCPVEYSNLGWLALSCETMQRECFLYGQSPPEHTLNLLAHGLAHLFGYEHGQDMYDLSEQAANAALGIFSGEKCLR